MARAMKKFSAGGAQGRYNRRMADIDKDFTKDSKGKSGRALEVLEAKRAQRTADAKDDLAKRTGADRTATRAAERAAESNLTKTRKYGAPQSVTKDTAGPTGKVTDTLGALTAPKSELANKPQSFAAAFKEARAKAIKEGRDPNKEIFTWGGKKKVALMATAPKPAAGSPSVKKNAAQLLPTGKSKSDIRPIPTTPAKTTVAPLAAKKGLSPAEYERALKTGTIPGTASAEDRANLMATIKAKRDAGYAKGGTVKKKETTMKYRSGGSTPPKPTAADRAADAKFRKSIKNLKPTPEQAAAIGRANRSSGYAKGGKVKKMAVGGMSTMPSTTANTAAPAANTAANTAAPTANTAARATTPSPAANTAPPATAAQATTPPPAATATAPAPYKPITPLQNVQNFINRRYGSATPNRDASATANPTTQASTPAKFDRNQSLRDFNSVARTFLNHGVSNKELIQAQGQLKKLQMDSNSTPAQHQAAIQSIIARMNSLVPKKAAKGGSMKAANKSGRALVKKSADTEGRAMKKFAAGGLTSGHKAANGVAKKGLTKGKQVKMNKGGACYAKGGSVRSIDGIATKGKTRCKGARK
jgi:hypothetical protein